MTATFKAGMGDPAFGVLVTRSLVALSRACSR